MCPPPSEVGRASRARATTVELGGLLEPQPNTSAQRKQVWIFILLLLLSVASYLAISRFIVTAVVVQGRSMLPTLQDGERCFLDRLTLKYRDPRRGDLVVIKDPGHDDYAVKRVIATPGELIALKEGVVLLNGHPLTEPYLSSGTKTRCPSNKAQYVLVGREQYFVLGDNRENSEDSRYYGSLSRANIVGLLSK